MRSPLLSDSNCTISFIARCLLILLLCSVLLRTTSHICIPNCFAIIILRMIFSANLQLLHRLNLNCSLASKNNRPPDYTLCIIVLWKNYVCNLLYWLYFLCPLEWSVSVEAIKYTNRSRKLCCSKSVVEVYLNFYPFTPAERLA